MMKRTFLVATLVAMLGDVAHAGTGSVDGTMISETGKPVPAGIAVTITCGSVRKTVTTDSAGHFAFSGLPAGACTISSTSSAFRSGTISVEVASDSIATVLVSSMSKTYQDQERKAEADMLRERREHPVAMRGRAPARDLAPVPAPPAPMEAKRGGGHIAPKPMPAGAPPVAPPPPPPPPPVAQAAQKKPQANDGVAIPERPVRLRGHADGKADVLVANDRAVNGWSAVRVFPVPTYNKKVEGPRSDFRETIYWNAGVETNDAGDATVSFVTNDSVTAFKASVEGFSANGLPGTGELEVRSKLPMSLEAHLPVEVTSGDTVRLPVTMTNETDSAIEANLDASFGSAFKLAGSPGAGQIRLAAGERKTVMFPLSVVATTGTADVRLALTSDGLSDELVRKIRVVPRGFPIEHSVSGTVATGKPVRHDIDLTSALPGSMSGSITIYPSPVAAMTQGMAGMIREPGGCFEQASSTNYPNIMILGYLNEAGGSDPALIAQTQTVLDKGYKLLTGYETPEKGYEWFGKTPGHEALTAYGLMEFADMAKVYDVDRSMVERTATWLMSRRDHKGGFSRSSQALDTFGRANDTTTSAYIMWALAEAKRTNGMTAELDAQKALAAKTTDPYLLALATNALAASNIPSDGAKRLAALQAKDGSFPGAAETITKSGGESVVIETTALATMALVKASPKDEYEPQLRSAVHWLDAHRGGFGQWSNTQATILALKALTAYTNHARKMAIGGTATLVVNGKAMTPIVFDKGRKDAIVWNDLPLVAGHNQIEVRLDGGASLPYSIAIDSREVQPTSNAAAKVAVTTELGTTRAKQGDGITLKAHVENRSKEGVPMTLARIGLPGGATFQTWQLKELRDKGLVDFYETRPREVVLYWRDMGPSAKKDVELKLLATTPGTYEGPASSAYLYYTAEDKTWAKPVALTIE